jgi:DNA repair protein RadC
VLGEFRLRFSPDELRCAVRRTSDRQFRLKETSMKFIRRSAHNFNVRSDRGFIVTPSPSFTTSFVAESNGAYQNVSDEVVIAEALRILSRQMLHTDVLSNPRVTRQYLAMRFAGLEHEVFACLYLNNRNRVVACEELFRGTIDGASVHPREVVKRALLHNAAAVVFAHNHPSGIAEPSQADELITRRLREALALVDIRVLDHFVVGGEVAESFAERGLL